jgi:MFS family permease
MGSSGYGVLLGALGVGAIVGAVLLPRVRARFTQNQLLAIAGLLFGPAMVVVAVVPNAVAVTLALIPTGLAWMTVISSVNAAMQLFLPGWVRARGLSIYQVVFAGAQALGALAWGALAEVATLQTAYLVAAALMIVGAVTVRWWPLIDVAGVDRSPAAYWPEPHLTLEPDLDAGPVLISATYRVRAENRAAFVTAMQAVRRSRQRTGASRWGLFRDGADPAVFVEVYLVPSWEEHLRQHAGRLTGNDQVNEQAASALAEGPAAVSHLLPADSPDLPHD